jgi:uncharacterized protein (DUF885 family)/isochorismate hydrolase
MQVFRSDSHRGDRRVPGTVPAKLAGAAFLAAIAVACSGSPPPTLTELPAAMAYRSETPRGERWATARNSALIVMDMQNTYMPVYRQASVFANIQALVDKADEEGALVVWVYTDEGNRGTPRFEIAPPLAPEPGHHSVVKTGSDAFAGTELKAMLTEAGVGRVVVCGLASGGCVNATALGALAAGFRTVIAADAHTLPRGPGGESSIDSMNETWRARGGYEVRPAASVSFVVRSVAERGLGPEDWPRTEAIALFLDEYYRPLLARSPETATQLGLSPWAGLDDSALDGLSPAYAAETRRLEREALETLGAWNRTGIALGDRLDLEAALVSLKNAAGLHRFADRDYLVNPTVFGLAYATEAIFADIHPVEGETGAQSYLARLAAIEGKLDGAVEALAARDRNKATAPRAVLESSLPDIKLVAVSSPRDTVFYRSLAEKLGALASLDGERKAELLAEAERIIARSVLPAYGRLATAVERSLKRAPEEVGVWKVPGGEDWYKAILKARTTTDLSPEAIHQLGLDRLERIHAEILELGARHPELAGSTAAEVVGKAFSRANALGAAEALAGYAALLDRAQALARPLFPDYPKAPVAVGTAPQGGYYQPGPVDGSRPGVFFVAEGALANRAGMPTLLHHETVPGHHLQIASSYELPLPTARKLLYFESYTEGWALYAERLMAEAGAYEGDPAGDVGRLQAEAFRAARLVVDTGIHAMRWTIDQSVDFMAERGFLDRRSARFEVIRYVSVPGQAVTYYLGFLRFLELRDRAKAALGDAFSLPAFHRTVLSCGPLPLDLLGLAVDRWIEEAKASR